MHTKRCSSCRLFKEVNEFSKNKNAKDGLHNQCKACRRECQQVYKKKIAVYQKQYQQTHSEEIAVKGSQYHRAHKKEITARKKRYRQAHKKEIAAHNKQYRQEHKDKLSIKQRQYYQTHGSERRQYDQANKARKAAWQKRYLQTEAGRNAWRKANDKRRALKLGAVCEEFTCSEVFERDKYRCQLCGRKTRPTYNRYHSFYPNLDHIIPLSVGGAHTKQNTQCLCRQCNMDKSNTGKGDQLRMFG